MREPNLSEFGRYLSECIKESCMTRASVAKACEVDRSYITILCNGLREPSVTMLFALQCAVRSFWAVDALQSMEPAPPSAGSGR